jgi:hypothetical protein
LAWYWLDVTNFIISILNYKGNSRKAGKRPGMYTTIVQKCSRGVEVRVGASVVAEITVNLIMIIFLVGQHGILLKT